MIAYLRIRKEDYGQGVRLSEDREKEILQEYIKATASLNRATDIGSLFISKHAIESLKRLRNREQLDYYNEPRFEFYEAEFREHENALSELLRLAINDLKRT